MDAACSVSGPGALCVGPRRSLRLCLGPALSVSGPVALCVWARRSLCRALCRALALSVSGPVALCVWARRSFCQAGPQAESRVPPIQLRAPSSDPCAAHPAAGPQLKATCHPSCPARSILSFQKRTPNLTVWGIKTI